MCGIAGFIGRTLRGDLAGIGRNMADALVHRGPDDAGVWTDSTRGVVLAHRRLSILDLSPNGHQPMQSANGRYVIAFNGEIYNWPDLKRQVESAGCFADWRGRSDTEVFLEAVSAWGPRKALELAQGMFAFALWDKATKELFLARDRVGEKPLYYGIQNGTFYFASELKAILRHPEFSAEIDRDALALLLRYNCIPAPHSIYKGVYKLCPGSCLVTSAGHPDPAISRYWSAGESVMRNRSATPFRGTTGEAVDALDHLLSDAVRRQMVTDVPIGAFLSGGIDSSTVVALMQEQSMQKVRTFTIGFEADDVDEARHAKAVAAHLGTEHTECYVSTSDAMEVIPRLPEIYDEPFSDSSQIPTFLVSRLARQHVTVSLSGDAGDELFGGYNRYLVAGKYWNGISSVPVGMRHGFSQAIQRVRPGTFDRWYSVFAGMLPARMRHKAVGEKLHKLATILDARDIDDYYQRLSSHFDRPEIYVIGASAREAQGHPTVRRASDLSSVERMMEADLQAYLPDDILTKIDRAAMAVSLETRIPLLDPRVVDFAWSLPLEYKIRDGVGKWPLRQILYRRVPRELIERPKCGFGVPLGDWLRTGLRDWAESLLSVERLRSDGYFHSGPVRAMWDEHLGGVRNWQHHLWDVLMFGAWLESTRQRR